MQQRVSWAALLGLSWDVRLAHSNTDLSPEDRTNVHARQLGPLREVLRSFGPRPIPFCTTDNMGTVPIIRTDGGAIHRSHVNWLTTYVDKITKKQGARLHELCSMMASGVKVTEAWGDLR
ncbi:hypothetical protein TruAng_009750 [Truncatella angustata]|nr:hypothetical protein TruAng_009750 [Truncatella angustata]